MEPKGPNARSQLDREALKSRLLDDLQRGRLTLPGLPELALQVREEIERSGCTHARLARIVQRDPAIATRVLKLAQSAARRTGRDVSSLESAVARLGLDHLRTLVTSLCLLRMLNAVHASHARLVGEVYRHSIEVGTLARVLAQDQPHLDPGTALLAGLMHDIGKLAIARYLDSGSPDALSDEAILGLIQELHAEVGARILQAWDFPASLVAVARWHDAPWAPRSGPVDYLDLVQVANLEAGSAQARDMAPEERAALPAYRRLGLAAQGPLAESPALAERLQEARDWLSA